MTTPRDMTGLERVEAMRDGRIPHPAMANPIQMRLAHATCTCAILRPPAG